jgi:acetoacetate decarboxylase
MFGDRHRLTEGYSYGAKLLDQAMNRCVRGIALRGYASICGIQGSMGDVGYTHCMFLNDEGPIAGGRELWGFPKKLGQPTLRTEIDTLIGTLDYGPVRVATGTMGYKHREADLAQVKAALEEPNFLLKIIPHVDGTPRICELVEYHLEQLVLKGAWTGPAALSLTPHALAPVADLPVLDIVSAIHIRADLTLGLGKVVHDYLQQSLRRPVRTYERSLVT